MIIIIGVVLFFSILILLRIPLGNYAKRLNSNPTPTPVPTVTPFRTPLPQGKQVYNVSRGGKSSGPNIQQVIIDPFDPKKGEMQKFWVKIGSVKEVKSATIILYADDNSVVQPLKLTQGDNKNGLWEGGMVTLNSHDYLYRLHVTASDEKDSSRVELSFR